MSAWSDTRLVAGREIDEKLHSKAFLWSIVFFLVVIAASVALPAVLSDDGPERYDVAVVGSGPQELAQAVRTEEVEVTAVPYDTPAAAEDAVRDEDVDAALLLEGSAVRLVGLDEVPEDLVRGVALTAQLRGLSTALTEAGVDAPFSSVTL